MKRIKFLVPVLALGAFMFVSCEKDDVTNRLSLDAIDVAAANSLSEQTVVDMQTMSEESVGGTSLKSASVSDSSIVPSRDRFRFNIDSTLITIDFGTGTVCRDGKIRKGKVVINRTLSPSKDREGSVIVFSTDGYEVNGNVVVITKTVTCLGWMVDDAFPNGYLKYRAVVEDGQITRVNGDVITVNVDHTRKLVAFEGRLKFAGWVIGGTSSHSIKRKITGNILSGNTEIIRELQRPLRHHHFIAGEFVSTFASGKSVTVDYGLGNLFDQSTWGKREIVKSGDAMESQNQE